jgi:DNA primase
MESRDIFMAGMFDNTIVSQIQQANDIVDVISEHVNLTKKGREMVGLCPFHDDHKPSMCVNSVKQIFKCFACGAGGDVFKFVQMRENLTFPQAIERLAERVGIKIQPAKFTKNQEPTDVDPNRLAKANVWATKHFQANLADKQKGKIARDYISKRQINDESVKTWQLGVTIDSQDDLVRAAGAEKASVDLLIKGGLAVSQNQDKFINRLMFPITDVTGRIIGFGGRTLDDAGAKYINSPTTALFDKSNSLYGLQQARHHIVSSGAAVVVEGYMDCLMAHQFGCKNVVATLGTSFTAGHGRILKRYAQKVVLLFDSDVAGLEAANRALEVCLSQHIDIKLASVPTGKDPCDFLLAAGKEAFEKLIDEAADVFEYKWNRLTKNLKGDEIFSGKKSAIEEFMQTIATSLYSGNLTAIDRGLITNRLSKIIGISPKEIADELNKRVARISKNTSYNLENRKIANVDLGQGLFATAQREILEVLLNEPKLFEIVEQKITAKMFDTPILSQIASVLFEALSTKTDISLAEILAKVESVETGNAIVELARIGEEKGNFQPRLTGAVETMQRLQGQGSKNEIKTIEEQTKFLRSVHKNIEKENPYNVGLT